jgi:uncharacterized protein (TIGR03067 family)
LGDRAGAWLAAVEQRSKARADICCTIQGNDAVRCPAPELEVEMIGRVVKAQVVLLLALACLAPGLARAGDDQQALQGTWSDLSERFDGAAVPQHLLVGNRTEFKGSEYIHIYRNEFAESGTFRVDPNASPKAIDFMIQKGPHAGQTQPGIYKLEGDTLTVCTAHPDRPIRPTQFATVPGDGLGLTVLKRASRP